MHAIEIEGKTIDEAIEKACEEFQMPREKLNIEIISEGASGFLGLGAKKARIKAGVMSIDVSNLGLSSHALKKEEMQEGKEGAETAPETPVSSESQAPATTVAIQAKLFLEGLLARMSLDCPVTVEETADSIVLNINGDGGGLLIGKRGQNLDAMQYIVNKVVNRAGGDRKMIVIDSEAYRKRREESLISMAEKLGDKVKRTKKPVTVSHMHAHDRRIIHLALQNDEKLITKSRGEGEYRKIIIMPVKKG
ncbi:MAG: protein jag [Deltaproteobacteria bacterium]|nr:protein jag [Deltaproteobacteria bacterium]